MHFLRTPATRSAGPGELSEPFDAEQWENSEGRQQRDRIISFRCAVSFCDNLPVKIVRGATWGWKDLFALITLLVFKHGNE